MVDDAAADEVARLREELAGAQGEIERLSGELTDTSSRRDEAAAEAAALRGEVHRLAGAASVLQSQMDAAGEQTRAATARYRELALRAEPGVLPELVAGDTIDDIDASLASARALAGRIRAQIEAESQAARVPAGAPERRGPDFRAMTPEQKIRYGLQQRREG
jgi:chromosome segregation ATPase